MVFFELEPKDISDLNDGDLRELVGRLCEAELIQYGTHPSCAYWGGAQEAADGGLDVGVKNATSINKSGFIPRKNTGFQVKKHTMGKAACTKEMQDKGDIKPVISELTLDKGAYIIVSGKDDCSDKMHSDRLLGMKNAVEDLTSKEDLLLDFYGRDRLATWLRQFPGVALWVRSRLGKPLSGWKPFSHWTATPIDKDDEFLMDEHPCVIDLNSQQKDPMSVPSGIELVRDKLREQGSVVRITGLSGVGKTRFAQALFETEVCENALPVANVIYADLGEDLRPTASELISYLIANDFSAYVVLDNCPPNVHRKLQKQVSENEAKLSLLTIEYDISDDRPEETDVVHIEPSSEKNTSKLIQKRFPDLGSINADKVAEFAGGNARVAVVLAGRVEADETLTNFSDEELFQRLFSQRKGVEESLLESAEILSLVYSFNVSKSEFNDELSVLAEISGLERRTLMRSHSELLRRHLSQQRGNWRAVLPHALSNRLARRALQNLVPDDINSELFKQENLRLFKSCAHRLGYLHDIEPARTLASTWMQQGAPLYDITTCNEELLTALDYITPVLPEAVLSAIEKASENPIFCSKSNRHLLVFVRLLSQLAYDDVTFDRTCGLLLKFAENENLTSNNSAAINRLENLFSLYLSGTHATPARRQTFLGCLVTSENPTHLQIAYKLFQSAFRASSWTSYGNFDFGARKRDYGWEPKTRRETLNWYEGFIKLLLPLLESGNELDINFAKEVLADNFRGLWTYAGCFDILEDIVGKYARNGNWPQMWMSIKQTLHYDGKNHEPGLLYRLKELEQLASPSDLLSEIKSYALVPIWEHAEIRGENYEENTKKIHEKIVNLGKLAVLESHYLKKLAPQLWEKQIDALMPFGKGLALGSRDQSSTFDFLILLMQEQELDIIQPILFGGYIKGVYTENPELALQLQERVLEIQELKPHFVSLLGETPIATWGTNKLIELAKSKELDAWRFKSISYGRVHESIQDEDLAELLSAINNLEDGMVSTIDILGMRFFRAKDNDYVPSEKILSVGREAILRLLSIHRDKINTNELNSLQNVASECLSVSAPETEIHDIVESLCEGIISYQLYSHDLDYIMDELIKNFTELVLDKVFEDNENSDQLAHNLFIKRIGRDKSILNQVPVERLIKWCDGMQNRIKQVASAVSSYASIDKDSQNSDNPKQVKLSDHIKSLLEISENKTEIIEIIFSDIQPSGWSGSLADIIETRAKAFSELLDHSLPEVRESAKTKFTKIEKIVQEEKKRESERNTRREQRFE